MLLGLPHDLEKAPQTGIRRLGHRDISEALVSDPSVHNTGGAIVVYIKVVMCGTCLFLPRN